ncbi:MAG: hypothetical protein IKD04_05545 [Clostridia bacterium]|nr:hypothetical protein [Clostridia bacterium]
MKNSKQDNDIQITELIERNQTLSKENALLKSALALAEQTLEEEEKFLSELKTELSQLRRSRDDAGKRATRFEELTNNTSYGRLLKGGYRLFKRTKQVGNRLKRAIPHKQ